MSVKIKSLIVALSVFFFIPVCGQTGSTNLPTTPALMEAGKWFSAWEFVSKEIYDLPETQPVDFVFFDTTFVYSTSLVSIPNGEDVSGPKFFRQQLKWKKQRHHGKIILPTGQPVPVGLMSFTSPGADIQSHPFFVMPLLEFWKKSGVESKELGLEKLITGVFLHEFSHSQQVRNFGKKISVYETALKYKVEFSDDIVQEYFENDSVYHKKFRNETAVFFDAVFLTDNLKRRSLITKGMNMLKLRQQQYFTDTLILFKEIDDFFLTMEGMGQYTMYKWLVHPKGGNVPEEAALKGVRRGGRSWSQDEGLSLFLVYSQVSEPKQWARIMFGTETISIVQLLNQQLLKHK